MRRRRAWGRHREGDGVVTMGVYAKTVPVKGLVPWWRGEGAASGYRGGGQHRMGCRPYHVEQHDALDDLARRGEQRSGAKFAADGKAAYGKPQEGCLRQAPRQVPGGLPRVSHPL